MSDVNKIKDTINKLTEKYSKTKWEYILVPILKSEAFEKLMTTLMNDITNGKPFAPAFKDIFKSFDLISDPENVKVVFVNDKPFNQKGIADGLAFSCNNSLSIHEMPVESLSFTGNRVQASSNEDATYELSYLPAEGVMLLNATATIPIGLENEHAELWESITKQIIAELSSNSLQPIVWVFVGENTEHFGKHVDEEDYKFFIPTIDKTWDCLDVFNKINHVLLNINRPEINW